jgi:CheY-like chemotaxis protein
VPLQQPQSRAGSPAPGIDTSLDRERLIVVADPDVESGKVLMSALAAWGLQPVLVHDGVEAMLTIQRMLPRAAILDAALPKMYGFQICEMVKRNESLRSMHVVLVGSVHHQDRYRRPPSELYGADVYMEKPELPEGLGPVLSRLGYTLSAASAPPVQAPVLPPAPQAVAPQSAPLGAEPATQPVAPVTAPPAAELVSEPQPVAPVPVPAPAPDSKHAEQRANAERLARIIVSDILLYHPEQFEAGLASGQLAEALDSAIQEGRGFFAQRVDPAVRDERDYILDELNRVAHERGGR